MKSNSRFAQVLNGFKRLAPWAVAVAILGYIFAQVPISEALEAASTARYEVFLAAMAAAVLTWFLIDSAAFAFLFSRYNTTLSWAQARSLRGMTYLATPINWNLGTAAVILHLRSSKNINALDSSSTMIFYQTIDAIILTGYVVLGTSLLDDTPEIISLRNTSALVAILMVALLALQMGNQPGWRWLARLRNTRLFQAHRKATLGEVALLCVMKALYFSVFIGVFWFGCHAFGVNVPLQLTIAATPAILLAAAIPITPAGLGTQQAAMIYFFSPYGDEASILAFGLTFPVALILFRCLLGLIYLKELPQLRQAVAERRANG